MALIKCGECHNQVSDRAAACPKCGAPVDASARGHSTAEVDLSVKTGGEDRDGSAEASFRISLSAAQLLGLVGSLIMFIGVFLPIVQESILGGRNLNHFYGKCGVIVMVMAAMSIFLCLRERYKGLWFTAGGSAAMLLFTFGHCRAVVACIPRLYQLEWGWAVLFVGCALVFAAAYLGTINNSASPWRAFAEQLGLTDSYDLVVEKEQRAQLLATKAAIARQIGEIRRFLSARRYSILALLCSILAFTTLLAYWQWSARH